MKERQREQNSLQTFIEIERLNRRKKPFVTIFNTCLIDFPKLDKNNLKILFTGSYQLSRAVCYLAELMDEHDAYKNESSVATYKR